MTCNILKINIFWIDNCRLYLNIWDSKNNRLNSPVNLAQSVGHCIMYAIIKFLATRLLDKKKD
jgi:hypothetical protein